jgi:hypothetical protein
LTFNGLQDISQETEVFITTAVRTSYPINRITGTAHKF